MFKRLIVAACVILGAARAPADPEMCVVSLELTASSVSIEVDETVTVTLALDNCPAIGLVGWQSFISYDTDVLEFVSGTYTARPFENRLVDPITSDDGLIASAAGVALTFPPVPSSASNNLVYLTFRGCGEGQTTVYFVEHDPPTVCSDAQGGPVWPVLIDSQAIQVGL